MKYYLVLLFFVTSLFSMDDGAALYGSCKFCHGVKADKIYVDVVPAIKNMDAETLTIKLKEYKKGTVDSYGYGPIMKQQMKNIPDEKISILVNYIKNL